MRTLTPLRVTCRALAAAGLVTDASIHLRLASRYDPVAASVSQGTLFRIESAVAILAAVLVVAWRHWIGDAFALGVAAAGLAAVLVYRYIDVGRLGPLPNMYEPIWYSDKTWSAIGQAVAVAALSLLLFLPAAWSGDESAGPRRPSSAS
jgi:hypothetical protein